jgi:hypothetical protein
MGRLMACGIPSVKTEIEGWRISSRQPAFNREPARDINLHMIFTGNPDGAKPP